MGNSRIPYGFVCKQSLCGIKPWTGTTTCLDSVHTTAIKLVLLHEKVAGTRKSKKVAGAV
jgi:hypothetical protein